MINCFAAFSNNRQLQIIKIGVVTLAIGYNFGHFINLSFNDFNALIILEVLIPLYEQY